MNLKNYLPDFFYFIRHGESISNKLDLVNGWANPKLTDHGKEQARNATEKLKKISIKRIITSDLHRAVETANILAKELNVTNIEKSIELRERNWGIYENQPRAIRPALDATPEEGESPEAFRIRILSALKKININTETLIVSHAGVLRVIREEFELVSYNQRVDNAVPVKILTSPLFKMEVI